MKPGNTGLQKVLIPGVVAQQLGQFEKKFKGKSLKRERELALTLKNLKPSILTKFSRGNK